MALAMTPNSTPFQDATIASGDHNLQEALRGPSAAWVAEALAAAERDPLAAAIDAATVARVLVARAVALLGDELCQLDDEAVAVRNERPATSAGTWAERRSSRGARPGSANGGR
jgi:hypothetical protein